jgi:hypothetical protein
MATIKSYNMVSTGSITIPVDLATSTPDVVYEDNIITGSVTLAATVSVVAGGTPTKGQKIRIYWDATVAPATFDVNVLGTNLPTNTIKGGKFVIECLYDGTAWVVDTRAIILEDDSVVTTAIADNNVTNDKLADMTRGTIKVGGAANAPTDLDAKTSGQILVGDGTDVASVAVSGDATLASSGALTIAAGAVDGTKLAANSRKNQINIYSSFENASELGVVKYKICYDCTVDAIHATVTKASAAGTMTCVFKDNSSAVLTGSQIDASSALALGNIVSTTPTANNTFSAGDTITLEKSIASGAAGILDITLCVTMT